LRWDFKIYPQRGEHNGTQPHSKDHVRPARIWQRGTLQQWYKVDAASDSQSEIGETALGVLLYAHTHFQNGRVA
jgi:hypothetical protein